MSLLVQGARVVLRRCTVLSHCAMPVQPSREAGHSHWHNIRHIKEANDSLKQKVAIDVVRKIKVAVQEGGSTNPKLNSALARVLEEGKAKDVSSTTMLETLKRMEKKGATKGTQMFVEGQGIGNSSIVVEAHTEKAKWLRQQIQHVLKQYGGRIGDSGTVSHNFTFKGVVYTQAGEGVAMDDALEAAIEAGAEDVRLVDDDTVFQFICEPREVRTVRTALEGRGFKVQEARQEYLPHAFVRLDADTLMLASKMLDQLDAIEDVTRVFDNIEAVPPES